MCARAIPKIGQNIEVAKFRSRRISNLKISKAQNIENARYRITLYRMAKYRPRKISNAKYRVVKYQKQNILVAKYRTQIIEGTKYRKKIEQTKY